jgi:HPt (histidine-containing phosphotransfer) domain-containing protein
VDVTRLTVGAKSKEGRILDEQTDDQPAIDLQLLCEIIGENDEAVLFEIIEFLVGELPPLLTALESAIAARDPSAVRNAAHAAKSATLSAAATRMTKVLRDIELKAPLESWTEIDGLWEVAGHEFVRIVAFQSR